MGKDNNIKSDNKDAAGKAEGDCGGNQEIDNLKGKEEYEKIFNNGTVNVKELYSGKIFKRKREVEIYDNIDLAKTYIKSNYANSVKKHRNMVEATRVYYEKELESDAPSASIFSYMAILISIVTLSDTLTENGKEVKVEGGFFKSTKKVYDITGTIIEPSNSDQCLFIVLLLTLVVLILLTAITFFSSLWSVRKDKQILKYLTYLEKQLESDK